MLADTVCLSVFECNLTCNPWKRWPKQKPAQHGRKDMRTQRQSQHARFLDPYTAEARRAMVTCSKVEAYLMSRTEDVSIQPTNVPTLPVGNPQRRKFKKPIVIHIGQKMKVEVHGLLGSGAFAHVFSVIVKNCNLVNKCMAMKVSVSCLASIICNFTCCEVRKK